MDTVLFSIEKSDRIVDVIPYTFLHYYRPKGERAYITKEERLFQDQIWLIKKNNESENHQKAIEKMTNEIIEEINGNNIYKTIDLFVTIPTSNMKRYESRFKKMTEEIEKQTGINCGNSHIKMTYDKKPLSTKIRRTPKTNYILDADYFKNKNILVIDDIITKGKTLINFNKQIKGAGGRTSMCIIYAKTKYKKIE